MTNEKKEVKISREEIESRSNLKASYLIVGLIFFLAAIFVTLSFKDSGLFAILLIVTGILFFINGISYYDYGDLLEKMDSKTDKQKMDLLLRKSEWHNEIDLSLKIAFGIGGLFLLLAVFLFITNSKTYFLAILFCDCIGATTLTYAFKLNDYKARIEEYEKTLEELEKQIKDKNWNFQGIDKK